MSKRPPRANKYTSSKLSHFIVSLIAWKPIQLQRLPQLGVARLWKRVEPGSLKEEEVDRLQQPPCSLDDPLSVLPASHFNIIIFESHAFRKQRTFSAPAAPCHCPHATYYSVDKDLEIKWKGPLAVISTKLNIKTFFSLWGGLQNFSPTHPCLTIIIFISAMTAFYSCHSGSGLARYLPTSAI